jgi:hypothetical protein
VYLFMLFAVLFLTIGNANAQEALDSNYFISDSSTLLLLDIKDQSKITGSLHSNTEAKNKVNYIEIPLDISNLNFSKTHLTTVLEPTENFVIGYNRQPLKSNSTLLMNFSVTPSEQTAEFGDSFQFTPPRPGLYTVRNGLRTRIYYQGHAARDMSFENMSTLRFSPPDAVGFILPDGYEGRTIGASGQMFSPTPIITSPIFSFSSNSTSSSSFIVDFSRPEPGWFKDFTQLSFKVIGIIIPVILIYFTRSGDVNRRRYKIVSVILIALIILIYSGLIWYSKANGLGIRRIVEDAVFAALTIGATITAYWLTVPSRNQS